MQVVSRSLARPCARRAITSALAGAIKPIYTAPSAEAAQAELEAFEAGPWGIKFPTVAAAWAVGAFYYALVLPLADKALLLVVLSLLLLCMAWWGRRDSGETTPAATDDDDNDDDGDGLNQKEDDEER